MSSNERIVIGLETQIPYHSRKVFLAFLRFLKDYQPTKLICIGDFLDAPAPARWNRGTAAEYAGNLQAECNVGKAMLAEIRAVYDGPFGYHTSANHEARIDNYARTKAPAFADLEALRVKNLLDLDAFEIEELPTINHLTPDTVTTHGDTGSLSRYGGGTAIGIARRLGKNVICGHTHRHGIVHERFGSRQVFGMECGHMMDVKKATYIRDGHPNWSPGWGVLEIRDSGIQPITVTCSRNGNASLYIKP